MQAIDTVIKEASGYIAMKMTSCHLPASISCVSSIASSIIAMCQLNYTAMYQLNYTAMYLCANKSS